MNHLVIIDTKLIAYECFRQHKHILSMFNIIVDKCKHIPNPHCIFVMDATGRPKRKVDILPTYKANRDEANKKLSPTEQKRLEIFQKDYQLLEKVFPYFGTCIRLPNYEADDIANLMVEHFQNNEDYYLHLLSSDRDWLHNFMDAERIDQIHLKRGVLTHDNIEHEFDLSPEGLLYLQVFAGIRKENISGIYKLGPKKFKDRWIPYEKGEITFKEFMDNLEEEVNEHKGGFAFPEGFDNLRDLFERNYELIRNVTDSDLSNDERAYIQSCFGYKPEATLEDTIINEFRAFWVFNDDIKNFFGLS